MSYSVQIAKTYSNSQKHSDPANAVNAPANINNLDAIYNNGIPLGFNNQSLGMACAAHPVAGWGKRFEAFVIARNVTTMVKTDYLDIS